MGEEIYSSTFWNDACRHIGSKIRANRVCKNFETKSIGFADKTRTTNVSPIHILLVPTLYYRRCLHSRSADAADISETSGALGDDEMDSRCDKLQILLVAARKSRYGARVVFAADPDGPRGRRRTEIFGPARRSKPIVHQGAWMFNSFTQNCREFVRPARHNVGKKLVCAVDNAIVKEEDQILSDHLITPERSPPMSCGVPRFMQRRRCNSGGHHQQCLYLPLLIAMQTSDLVRLCDIFREVPKHS
jgi:hypothetical protein